MTISKHIFRPISARGLIAGVKHFQKRTKRWARKLSARTGVLIIDFRWGAAKHFCKHASIYRSLSIGLVIGLSFVLVERAIDDSNNLLRSDFRNSSILPELFIALGSTTFGALAIAFSISIFAIQSTIERSTFHIFQKLNSDLRILLFYSMAFIITVIFFSFSLLVNTENAKSLIATSLVLFLSVGLILYQYFKRILWLINPASQIDRTLDRAVSGLRQAGNRMTLWLRAGRVRLPKDVLPGSQEAIRLTKLKFFTQQPQIIGQLYT